MTALRFRARHVHKTLAKTIEAGLDTLGWVHTPINFKTTKVTFLEYQPEDASAEIKKNTVAVTLGDEGSDEPLELGAAQGGLWAVQYPFFVDIYGVDAPIALSIASDVKDVVADLGMYVKNFNDSSAGVDSQDYLRIERESIVIERPPASVMATDEIHRHWRCVKGIVEVTFQLGGD